MIAFSYRLEYDISLSVHVSSVEINIDLCFYLLIINVVNRNI